MAFWQPTCLGLALAVFALGHNRSLCGEREKHWHPRMNSHPVCRDQIRQDDDGKKEVLHPVVIIPSRFPVCKVFVHQSFITYNPDKFSQ